MKTLRKHSIAFDFAIAAVGLAGLWLLLNGQVAIIVVVGLILLAVSGTGAIVYHSHTITRVRPIGHLSLTIHAHRRHS